MHVFVNSSGFDMLEKHGFLKWGTEGKFFFLENFKSGTIEAFEAAIKYAQRVCQSLGPEIGHSGK